MAFRTVTSGHVQQVRIPHQKRFLHSQESQEIHSSIPHTSFESCWLNHFTPKCDTGIVSVSLAGCLRQLASEGLMRTQRKSKLGHFCNKFLNSAVIHMTFRYVSITSIRHDGFLNCNLGAKHCVHPFPGKTDGVIDDLWHSMSRGLFCLVCAMKLFSFAASAVWGRQLVLEQLIELPVISFL